MQYIPSKPGKATNVGRASALDAGAWPAPPTNSLSASRGHMRPRWWIEHWFILVGAVVFASPGLIALARNYWSTEQGAGGPIILMTGLWLLHHEAGNVQTRREPMARWLVPAGLLLMGTCTITAAVTAKQWLQLLGIYLSLALVLYGIIGWRQWLRLRVPILYLAFVIPPPDNLALPMTHALKELVATASVDSLAAAPSG